MFGLVIECDKHSGNDYYIANQSELENSTTYKWLLNTLAVTKLLSDNQQLYAKYKLDPDEISFIEKMIKPME